MDKIKSGKLTTEESGKILEGKSQIVNPQILSDSFKVSQIKINGLNWQWCTVQETEFKFTQGNCLLKQKKEHLSRKKNNRNEIIHNLAFVISRIQSQITQSVKNQKEKHILKSRCFETPVCGPNLCHRKILFGSPSRNVWFCIFNGL